MTSLLLIAATLAADPLPPGAVARFGSTRFRAPTWANTAVLSADNTRLAITGTVGVTVFDPLTGRRLFRLRGPEQLIEAQFAADGTLLLIGSDGDAQMTVTRHDSRTGRLVGVHTISPDRLGITAVSPDGGLIASSDNDGLRIVDIATGRPTAVIASANRNFVHRVVFSADGSQLILTLEDGGLHLYDRRTAARVAAFPSKETFAHIASSADGTRLAVASRSQSTVLILDPRDGRLICESKIPKHNIEQMAFAAAGLLVYGRDIVRILDPATGKERRQFIVTTAVTSLAVSRDGRTLYAGTTTGGVLVWDIESGELLPRSADPPERVTSLRFIRPDRLVAYMDSFGWYGYDRGESGGQRFGPPLDNRTFSEITLDETLMVRAGPAGLTITELHGAKRTLLNVPGQQVGDITYIEFAADNRTFYAVTGKGLRAWDLPAGTPRPFDLGPGGPPSMVLASPDNKLLSVIREAPSGVEGATAYLRLTDRATGAVRSLVTLGTPQTPSEMSVSRDSRRLMMRIDPRPNDSNSPPHLYVFDTATGHWLYDFYRPGFGLGSLALSPDGRCFATVADSRTMIVEFCTGGVRWSNDRAADGSPEALVFAADNRSLAIAGGTDPILLWDIRNRTGPLPKLDVEAAWRALASADAAEAYRAMLTLERHPAAAAELFRRRLKPWPTVDPLAVAGWLKQLSAPAYRDREAAMAGLAAVASRIQPQLRVARAKCRSPEVQERLDELLTVSDSDQPEGRRAERAAEVLAQIGLAR